MRWTEEASAPPRILSFDIETLAAGYADPAWVPDKITAAAWSWVGEDEVHSLITGKDGFWSAKLRGQRFEPLIEMIELADVVIGHNIIRFDLRVINAECLRCGLQPLGKVMVQDTIKLPKSKGFKKGLDTMATTLGAKEKKIPLNWAEWDAAYEVDGWPEVVERCESDVRLQKEVRELLKTAGALKPPTEWKP